MVNTCVWFNYLYFTHKRYCWNPFLVGKTCKYGRRRCRKGNDTFIITYTCIFVMILMIISDCSFLRISSFNPLLHYWDTVKSFMTLNYTLYTTLGLGPWLGYERRKVTVTKCHYSIYEATAFDKHSLFSSYEQGTSKKFHTRWVVCVLMALQIVLTSYTKWMNSKCLKRTKALELIT